MKDKSFKFKLRDNVPLVGTWQTIPSSLLYDVICCAGLDFVIIDREHGSVSFETIYQCAIVSQANKVPLIVRTGGNNSAEILKALDLGVDGIQIPNVTSASMVREVIKSSFFPPVGDRGFSPFTRAAGYGQNFQASYTKDSNDNISIIIQIEGKDGVAALDEILQIVEIDVIFVGLYDLSKSMGIPGQTSSSEVRTALIEISEKVKRAGKVCGSIGTNLDDLRFLHSIGIKYITYSVDTEVIATSYKGIRNSFMREIT